MTEENEENKPHQTAKSIRDKNNRRNLWMAILTLVVGGSLLSGLVYGWGAVLAAFPFLLIGALLILIPWFFMSGLDRFMEWVENRE